MVCRSPFGFLCPLPPLPYNTDSHSSCIASHAIETFGTHRLIFGSSPALPLSDLEHVSHTHTVGELEQPISNGEWYAVLRKCVAELGQGVEEMTGVMGANAAGVYDLHPQDMKVERKSC